MKQLNVTELDFDAIKDNLKDYFRNNPDAEYADWDFEGSGLNHLLDILAYNTHYNAVVAHNAMNESFIDSAQIRSNVVSRAKLLGYTPKSQTAAMSKITLTFESSVNRNLSTYTLLKGQTLTATVDSVTYTYVTLDDYTATLDEENAQYVFTDVVIYQGRMKESTFIVESGSIAQKFIIEDTSIDLDHLAVDVFDNAYSTSVETYSLFTSLSGIGPSTAAYFINENYDGNYEIQFGDNIFGKRPASLNVIKIKYLSTVGKGGNGANVFKWTSPTSVTPSIVTASGATNGSGKEDIDSIRQNAPLSFITQNRAVTSGDYKTLISQILNNIETVSVWGGEDNVPPQYGKVYASIKPFDSEALTDLDKTFLLKELEAKRVIGIQPVLVDPDFTYLYFDILFKYNSNRTSFSSGQLSTKVETLLSDFNTNNLQRFEGVFRYSHLLSMIDDLDVAIINSFVRVYAHKKAVVQYGKLVSTPVDFQMAIYGESDQLDPVMSSDSWMFNGVSLIMEDEPIVGSTDERNIYAYTVGSDGIKRIIFKNVGVLNLNTGLISIDSLPINKTETINIYVTPAANDVVSKRNKLLSIDIGKTTITPELDTIAISGSSGVSEYTPFLRHRPDNS
tara:strand:+ start:2923 stop:4779 length:1857 start_codon:yes stop_codon:yes gene_type:complete